MALKVEAASRSTFSISGALRRSNIVLMPILWRVDQPVRERRVGLPERKRMPGRILGGGLEVFGGWDLLGERPEGEGLVEVVTPLTNSAVSRRLLTPGI